MIWFQVETVLFFFQMRSWVRILVKIQKESFIVEHIFAEDRHSLIENKMSF